MKTFIDFTDKLGSDSVIRVDGRLSIETIHEQAIAIAKRQRFICHYRQREYVIIRGASLLSAQPITDERTIAIDRSDCNS